MRSSTIDERFLSFVEEPTLDNYLSVREPIVDHARYDPYSDELRQLEREFQAGDFSRVFENAPLLLPIWHLSPRFHYLFGVSSLEIGDLDTAEREKQFSRQCLNGLTETGDGSGERPFLVTYLSDEYDLMRCMDVEVRQQQVVDADDRQLDVLRDAVGNEYWFDVTEVMAAAQRDHTATAPSDETRRPIVRQA